MVSIDLTLLSIPVPALNAGLIPMLRSVSTILKGRLKQHMLKKKIECGRCFYFGREVVMCLSSRKKIFMLIMHSSLDVNEKEQNDIKINMLTVKIFYIKSIYLCMSI